MTLEELEKQAQQQWPAMLSLWSRYVKLSDPHFCLTREAEKKEGLTGSFAMIRLTDLAVVISLRQVAELRLSQWLPAIMAHEIGHHVYCPGDLTDDGRMIARMRHGLPSREHLAPLVSNLYSDLLINDKLKREFQLPIEEVYAVLGQNSSDRMWTFYMRIYEILWGLTRGTLARGKIDNVMEGDAQLGNRLIRNFSRDWLKGAGRFAALCLPYLLENNGQTLQKILAPWLDAQHVGNGTDCPDGLTEIEADEINSSRHPALDDEEPQPNETNSPDSSAGQYREPFEYGQILKSMGFNLSESDITCKYYKERALPHLISFPQKQLPPSAEPQLEGVEPWDMGSPMEKIDWFETVVRSPWVIPGFTTVARTYGTSEGAEPEKVPIDLDVYVDSSGSMPNPASALSYLALAGTIVTLSALRAGARVQATLWSGPGQFKTTQGFIRDEKKLMEILTGYICGSTAFPIHVLRDTYLNRPANARKVHILVISDEGVTTMFAKDEQQNNGADVAQQALAHAGAGGTLVLNLYTGFNMENDPLFQVALNQGWDIHCVQDWKDLLTFARDFSRKKYGEALP